MARRHPGRDGAPHALTLRFAIPVAVSLLAAALLARRDLPLAIVFAAVVSVLAGEAMSRGHRARERAHARVSHLLQAVRVLNRVTGERAGAEIVASLCARLLDADAVAVLLADRAPSGRLLNRAWFGHPALADAAPLVIDLRDAGFDVTSGARFLRDARSAPVLAAPGAAGRIRSAVLLPLPGRGAHPAGLAIAMWGTHRRTLPPASLLAAELVAEEAGRVFEQLRAAAALTRDAQTDPLTQLANRRTFAHALATLRDGDAVVIVDVDHFKGVNDRYGHDAGDEVLRALAGCLRRVARQMDCVARYGGEEFALVLPEAGGAGALKALQRVRTAWAGLDPLTTFSAGVAVHEAGEDAAHTLRRADVALYEAKGAGRDRDVVAPAAVTEIVLS